jgi:hypothetical protein
LCIETSKELRIRLAEAVYEEHADQSLTKQIVTCSMDTAYPPIRNTSYYLAWCGGRGVADCERGPSSMGMEQAPCLKRA